MMVKIVIVIALFVFIANQVMGAMAKREFLAKDIVSKSDFEEVKKERDEFESNLEEARARITYLQENRHFGMDEVNAYMASAASEITNMDVKYQEISKAYQDYVLKIDMLVKVERPDVTWRFARGSGTLQTFLKGGVSQIEVFYPGNEWPYIRYVKTLRMVPSLVPMKDSMTKEQKEVFDLLNDELQQEEERLRREEEKEKEETEKEEAEEQAPLAEEPVENVGPESTAEQEETVHGKNGEDTFDPDKWYADHFDVIDSIKEEAKRNHEGSFVIGKDLLPDKKEDVEKIIEYLVMDYNSVGLDEGNIVVGL